MTTEEKQLLFKDICARLPYGIYCQIKYKRKNKIFEECKQLDGTFFNSIECLFRSESGAEYSTDYKPYLRPISSMTEQEENELTSIAVLGGYNNSVFNSFVVVDWLNTHHFDYRRLIEKGLVLEAPKGMYKIK